MVDHILQQRLVIGRARPEVFAFFADPARTAGLLPSWIRRTVVGETGTPEAGAVFDYRVVCLGVPFAWRAFIREFDPPFRFLDVQLRGPFARWEHRHRFMADGGDTLMEDRLVFRLPLGLAGQAAHAVALRYLVAAAWKHRTRRIAQLVGPVSAPPS